MTPEQNALDQRAQRYARDVVSEAGVIDETERNLWVQRIALAMLVGYSAAMEDANTRRALRVKVRK